MSHIPAGVIKPESPAALEPLKWLEGTWRCDDVCDGEFPTIKPFKYGEELKFECVGQPMLNYSSFSWHPQKKCPMHQESGFLKIKPGTVQVSLIVAHNFGLTTIEEGSVEGQSLKLTSKEIGRISFSNDVAVTKLVREFTLDGSNLRQTLWMETDKTPLCKHLEANYQKIE